MAKRFLGWALLWAAILGTELYILLTIPAHVTTF